MNCLENPSESSFAKKLDYSVILEENFLILEATLIEKMISNRLVLVENI